MAFALLGVGACMPAASSAAATLPAGLLALEQKTSELHVTSLRFSLQTSTTFPKRERQLGKVLKLFGADTTISGEATVTPSASNVTFGLFTLKLTMRRVDGVSYLYLAKLAPVDHGRPWIRLGPGGLGELFTINGKPVAGTKPAKPETEEPALVEPSFSGLEKLLAEAREVREVGPGTLNGQPVTRFLAQLEPAQLKSEALATSARRVHVHNPPPIPTTTLEVSLSPEGLPVQTIIKEVEGGITVTATLDIPAVSFPLVIEAPPAAQTIDMAEYRELAKRAEATARKRRRKTRLRKQG